MRPAAGVRRNSKLGRRPALAVYCFRTRARRRLTHPEADVRERRLRVNMTRWTCVARGSAANGCNRPPSEAQSLAGEARQQTARGAELARGSDQHMKRCRLFSTGQFTALAVGGRSMGHAWSPADGPWAPLREKYFGQGMDRPKEEDIFSFRITIVPNSGDRDESTRQAGSLSSQSAQSGRRGSRPRRRPAHWTCCPGCRQPEDEDRHHRFR